MSTNPLPERTPARSLAIWAALLVAVAAASGSLWLTLGMSLKACPLCLYQRCFILAAVAILALGLALRGLESSALGVLALVPAVAGFGVGLFHNYLEQTKVLECPSGIGGYGTAPQQALAAEAALMLPLLIASVRRMIPTITALLLGGAIAAALILSGPPLPKPTPPKDPFDMCRPVYAAPAPETK
jgi:disulfide bond formation protein DsbB